MAQWDLGGERKDESSHDDHVEGGRDDRAALGWHGDIRVGRRRPHWPLQDHVMALEMHPLRRPHGDVELRKVVVGVSLR